MYLSLFRAAALALPLIIIPFSSQAQSLTEALTLAYTNNPNIASAVLAVESSAENIALAKSRQRPNIGLGADYSASFAAPSGGQFTTNQNFQVGVSYQQNLFDNFQTDAQIEQARAGVELQGYALANAEQNALLSVADAYFRVIRDQQLVSLRTENVEFFRAQVQSAEDRLRIGEGTRIDVSQANARLAQAVASLQAASANLDISRASFQRWVGQRPQNLSASFSFGNLVPGSLDAALASADERHPAILSARAAIRVAQAGADIASSAFGPTLNLIGNICAIGCFGGAQQGASGSVRLSLSVPLYSGGALGAQVRQANLEQIQSEVDAMATRDQVREAVITSWSTLQNATAQIASAQTAVESGNLVLEGVIQERDVGQRTTLDVLNAQAELIAAREGLISATSTRSIATFSLIAATGRLSAVELGLNVRIRNGEEYRATVEDVWQELRALDVEQ